MMNESLPQLCFIGVTGVGKSTLGNTFLSGWTHYRHKKKASILEAFSTSADTSKACTACINKYETEHLFGNTLYGPCVLWDTPGFLEPGQEEKLTKGFLDWISQQKYITYFLFVTTETSRFVADHNKKILALLLHIFGPNVFNHVIVMINRWPMNNNSQLYEQYKDKYGCEKPEDKFHEDAIRVCSTLKQGISRPQLFFINNFHLAEDLFYWEEFEYKFARMFAHTTKMEIDEAVRNRCIYFTDNIKQVCCYEELAFRDNQYQQFAPKILEAERILEKLYRYWGEDFCSCRIIIINDSPIKLTKSSLIRRWGFYETSLEREQKLETLDNIDVEPYGVAWIFHRKRWGCYSGVEGELNYNTTFKSKAYNLTLYWDITRGALRRPTVNISGTLTTVLQISPDTDYRNTDTPLVRFKISII